MMTVFDSAGRWVWSGKTDDPDAQVAEAGSGAVIVPGEYGAQDYWTGEAVAPRPVPPAPPALVAGVEAVWTGLPVGAAVAITDPETRQVAGSDTVGETGVMPLTLPAGPWRIAVNEVFPALAAEWLVEVAAE